LPKKKKKREKKRRKREQGTSVIWRALIQEEKKGEKNGAPASTISVSSFLFLYSGRKRGGKGKEGGERKD